MVKDIFLQLVRLGIDNQNCFQINHGLQEQIDWDTIESIAARHGLSAVIVDGIEHLPDALRPPQMVLLQWIGESLQNYEQRYELCKKTISELAGWYNVHGFKMMVLKGYSCSLDWPKPEHRPCGDIDIWLFGKYKEADAALAKEKGIEIDSSHHHHTVFYWRDFMVENHYDFINVHHHKSNAEVERVLKELAQDDSHSVAVYGEKVYLPSANLHALFLLKHTMMHFAAEGISLRQLLDWGFFVKAHTKEIDWHWLVGVINQYGMTPAYNIFNAICVEDLGFDAGLFPEVQSNLSMKDKVMNEILNPEFGMDLPKDLFRRVRFKIRRWRGSAWKHELCYNDSMWNAFWSGIWGHLLKPTTI